MTRCTQTATTGHANVNGASLYFEITGKGTPIVFLHGFTCDHRNWDPQVKFENKKIQKGEPMQNGYFERFNRHYREDVLNMHIFETISQVREKTEEFMDDYNTNHPHDSLGNLSPIEFMRVKYSEKMPNFAS